MEALIATPLSRTGSLSTELLVEPRSSEHSGGPRLVTWRVVHLLQSLQHLSRKEAQCAGARHKVCRRQQIMGRVDHSGDGQERHSAEECGREIEGNAECRRT